METLIIHCNSLFDDQFNVAAYASSPPLPPAPLGEDAPPFAYGSTHTKFSGYGSQQPFNAPLPQTPTPQPAGDDFTPQFTPRPPASIHPSARGNTGSSSGHSNPSPTQTEAETNVTSPTSFLPPPPLPLRPGRQGALTPVQGLRGTKGLDFSQPESSEGDWTGPAPSSPPLSAPLTPPPVFRSPQTTPPPPSALPQSTFAHKQQPVLTQIRTQEQPKPNAQPPPPLPAVERTAVGDFVSITSPFETHSSSTVGDGHSTDHTSPITPDAATGPALQPAVSQPLSEKEPQVPAQLQNQPQVPIQAIKAQEESQPSSTRQPEEIPQGGRESQDPPAS
jgi:hypothetical protein